MQSQFYRVHCALVNAHSPMDKNIPQYIIYRSKKWEIPLSKPHYYLNV